MASTQTEKKARVELPGFLERDSVIDSNRSAKLLGISVVHLRRLVKAGLVPAPFTIGSRKFGWHAGTLQDFVAAKARQRKAA